jgi:hypothetical protein
MSQKMHLVEQIVKRKDFMMSCFSDEWQRLKVFPPAVTPQSSIPSQSFKIKSYTKTWAPLVW